MNIKQLMLSTIALSALLTSQVSPFSVKTETIFELQDIFMRDADNLKLPKAKAKPDRRRLTSITERAQLKALFEIFTTTIPTKAAKRQPAKLLYSPQLLSDLQFFNGNSRSIFSRINKTYTLSGSIIKASTLAEGCHDAAILMRRQAIIKELTEKETLRDRLRKLYKEIRPSEEILISIWANDQKGEIAKQIESESQGAFPNSSPLVKSLLKIGKHAWWNGVKYVGPAAAVTLAAVLFARLAQAHHAPADDFIQLKGNSGQAAGNFSLPEKIVAGVGLGALSLFAATQLPSIANNNLQQNLDLQDLVLKSGQGFIELVSYVNTLEQELIGNISREALPSSLAEISNMRAKNEALCKELTELIRQHRFFDVYYTLHDLNAEHIANMLAFVGEVDSYLSMSLLYVKHAKVRNVNDAKIKLCFAKLNQTSPTPYISATEYWNPILDAKIVKASCMTLGGTGPRDVVVTGPNAGGKSMNLRALLVQLMFFHSYLMGFAQELEATLFTFIVGQLKSIDDAAGDRSRLQMEAMAIRDILNKIRQLGKNEFAFIITDELFTGTEIEPAIMLSLQIGKLIAKKTNVIYMLATHFKPLTTLQTLTDGMFQNYHVKVLEAQGSLVYPYKLIPGVGECNVAISIVLEQLKNFDMADDELYIALKELQSNFAKEAAEAKRAHILQEALQLKEREEAEAEARRKRLEEEEEQARLSAEIAELKAQREAARKERNRSE